MEWGGNTTFEALRKVSMVNSSNLQTDVEKVTRFMVIVPVVADTLHTEVAADSGADVLPKRSELDPTTLV